MAAGATVEDGAQLRFAFGQRVTRASTSSEMSVRVPTKRRGLPLGPKDAAPRAAIQSQRPDL